MRCPARWVQKERDSRANPPGGAKPVRYPCAMGLIRLFLLLAVGWFIWRFLLRAALGARPSPPPPPGKEDYLPLTKCAICGAHIPRPQSNAAPIGERCLSR